MNDLTKVLNNYKRKVALGIEPRFFSVYNADVLTGNMIDFNRNYI